MEHQRMGEWIFTYEIESPNQENPSAATYLGNDRIQINYQDLHIESEGPVYMAVDDFLESKDLTEKDILACQLRSKYAPNNSMDDLKEFERYAATDNDLKALEIDVRKERSTDLVRTDGHGFEIYDIDVPIIDMDGNVQAIDDLERAEEKVDIEGKMDAYY